MPGLFASFSFLVVLYAWLAGRFDFWRSRAVEFSVLTSVVFYFYPCLCNSLIHVHLPISVTIYLLVCNSSISKISADPIYFALSRQTSAIYGSIAILFSAFRLSSRPESD